MHFIQEKIFGHTLVTTVSMLEGFLGAAGGVVTSPTGAGAVAGSAAVAHAGSAMTSAAINKARDRYVIHDFINAPT
ncbi:MAG: hypothetical protein ACOYVD_16755 [Bacillota bacterium]